MEPNNGVAVDVAVTADDLCDMSCEVEKDEVRFYFGTVDTGLQLDLDWRGFIRFMRVTSMVIDQLQVIPNGAPINFLVTANSDENGDIVAALRMASGQDGGWNPPAWPSMSEGAECLDTVGTHQCLPANLSSCSYVTVNGNGALTCEVLPDQIEIRFGDDNSGLHFFLNYRGFAKLVMVASYVVERLQSVPNSGRIDFKVSARQCGQPSEVRGNE